MARVAAYVVVIVVGLNLAVSMVFRQTTVNRGYDIIRSKWELVGAQEEPVDWLLLGDSTCLLGLVPEVFEAETGETALNLCTTGDMLAVGDLWTLEEYLDTVGPPRRGILVTHVYDVWPRSTDELEPLAWVVPAGDEWRRDRTILPATIRERVQATVGDWLPLVAQPESTWRLIRTPRAVLSAEPVDLTDGGFLRGRESDPDNVRSDIGRHREQIVAWEQPVSDANFLALDEMSRLARDADVPLVLAPAPLADELWDDDSFRRRYADIVQPVSSFAARTAGVVELRDSPWIYRVDQLEDANHVSEDVATIHTLAVVDALREKGLMSPTD